MIKVTTPRAAGEPIEPWGGSAAGGVLRRSGKTTQTVGYKGLMTRGAFTVVAAISLLLAFGILCWPRLTSAGHFWIPIPFGELGPFDNADESILFGLAILFAAPAVLWGLLALNRIGEAVLRHEPPAGCCQQCGYDLRATPERCPECGAIPTRPSDARSC